MRLRFRIWIGSILLLGGSLERWYVKSRIGIRGGVEMNVYYYVDILVLDFGIEVLLLLEIMNAFTRFLTLLSFC